MNTEMDAARALDPWHGSPCAIIAYPLTPARPIRVVHKRYAEPTSEAYDMHYAFELGIVTRGRMKRLYQRHVQLLEPGQAWLCGAWEPHGWCVTQGPSEAVVISILPPTLISPTVPELAGVKLQAPFMVAPALRPRVPLEREHHVLRLAGDLINALDTEAPRRALLERLLTYQILLELPAPQDSANGEAGPDGHYECVSRAIELVMKRRSFVSARQAARECALSERTFNACFGRAVGSSFAKFALRYRLDAAASQLLGTNDPVKAVGQDWGFSDASHFHAAFRAHFGCSPVRYREQRGHG